LDEPSTEVRAFIEAYIDSIDCLRVLLALVRQPGRDWTDAELAKTAQLSVEATCTQLDKFCANGFATMSPGPPKSYRYAPRAAQIDELVQQLIQLDNRRPVTLVRLVYAKTFYPAQAFADAFRFKKE
jgi:hypothetical protein